MANNFECWQNMDQLKLILCTVSIENGLTVPYVKHSYQQLLKEKQNMPQKFDASICSSFSYGTQNWK